MKPGDLVTLSIDWPHERWWSWTVQDPECIEHIIRSGYVSTYIKSKSFDASTYAGSLCELIFINSATSFVYMFGIQMFTDSHLEHLRPLKPA